MASVSRDSPHCQGRGVRPQDTVLSLASMRLAVMLGKFEFLFHKHEEKKTLFGGYRRGCVRGMDCALSLVRRGARHIVGHVGSRQLTGLVGWGNTDHPRHLWPPAAIYKDGSSRSEALEGTRKAVEASGVLSNRRFVDGAKRRGQL